MLVAQPCNTATGSPWSLTFLLWGQTPYQQPWGIDESRANIARKEAWDCWILLRSGPRHLTLEKIGRQGGAMNHEESRISLTLWPRDAQSLLAKTSVFPACSTFIFHPSWVLRGATWCYLSTCDSFGSDEFHAGWLRLENGMSLIPVPSKSKKGNWCFVMAIKIHQEPRVHLRLGYAWEVLKK